MFFHVSLKFGSQNGSQAKKNFNHFRLFSRHFSSFFAFKAFSAILVDFPCPGRPRTTKKHGKLNGKRWPKSFPRPPQWIQISSIWAGGGSGSAGSIHIRNLTCSEMGVLGVSGCPNPYPSQTPAHSAELSRGFLFFFSENLTKPEPKKD